MNYDGQRGAMNTQESQNTCLACGRDAEMTPLIMLEYRGSKLWICPQHLPILIHDPTKLIGKLPGAEALKPSEYSD
jgi:hypothetical protein